MRYVQCVIDGSSLVAVLKARKSLLYIEIYTYVYVYVYVCASCACAHVRRGKLYVSVVRAAFGSSCCKSLCGIALCAVAAANELEAAEAGRGIGVVVDVGSCMIIPCYCVVVYRVIHCYTV